ncbi:MAG: hypothetical protein OEW33_00700 [Nitrospirota bacterium]|jgi:hypothetical protein|nr:hypothetical protein [Nitrospirota bacterium]MDH4359245.1 hypothetical protein [Nitrospirota bacterium]
MPTEEIAIFKPTAIKWTRRTCSLMLTTLLLTACTQFSPSPGTGEKPIPPGIENQIYPNATTQDDVLALLGDPVVRLKTKTKEGHVHIWTYSYMDLQSTPQGKGESLTITFDDKSFLVLSVTRGPL